MIPTLNLRFNYPDLLRIDGDERLYRTPTGDLHSVTTILSNTDSEEDKMALQNWRNFVGAAKAEEITNEAATLGSLMHENLENRIVGTMDLQGSMPIRQLARRMADCIQENAWININEVWGVEAKLYYDSLWAGTSDLVGVHKGTPAIMDYKNSRRVKTRDEVHGYFMQGAAYALAHNLMFGTDIQKVVVFMCVRKDPKNLQYLEFSVEGAEYEHFRDLWIHRVTEFYTKRGLL